MVRILKITALIIVTNALIFSCGKDDPKPSVCTEITWYRDADGDGLGNPNFEVKNCVQPDGYVSNRNDDNDAPVEAVVLPTVSSEGYDFTAVDTDGWELIWEDNFTSDLSSWNEWNGGAFNNELQLYQSGNLFLDDTYLFIRQHRVNSTGPTTPFDNTSKSFNYTSGRIESKTLYSPSTSGDTIRFAARLKLPEGEGLWPAFWSYGDPWPTQGEIDIIEYRGGEPEKYITNFFYGTETNMPLTDSGQQTKIYTHSESLANKFHVYELEWTKNVLVMKFDGQVLRTYGVNEFQYVDDMFNKQQKIVLNLAVGGDFFQNLNTNAIPDESFLIVDWVKVYKR